MSIADHQETSKASAFVTSERAFDTISLGTAETMFGLILVIRGPNSVCAILVGDNRERVKAHLVWGVVCKRAFIAREARP
jgi:hypothetical protein